MAKFDAATWIQRTSVTGLSGSVQAGHQSPFLDEKIFVMAGVQVVGGAPEQIAIGNGAVSRDKGFTWQNFEASPHVPGGEAIAALGSAQRPDGSVLYFKLRFRFGRSFFVANNTIFQGHIAIDTGLAGTDWTESQKLYTWPHKPDTGSGGQASFLIQGGFLFLPGSGPNGADADWLLIRALVGSGQGNVVDDFAWWRSDDFGQTWNRIRTETTFGGFPNFITRGQTGRLLESDGGVVRYSDDHGETWTGSSGVIFGPKTNGYEQSGNTWCLLQPATGTGQGNIIVSCDNGVSLVGGQQAIGTLNGNVNGIRLSPCELLAFISGGIGVGQEIWYTSNGGEDWSLDTDARMTVLQGGVVQSGLFNDGMPIIVLADNEVFVSNDRATGQPTPRSVCPLAFAGLVKAGIPNLCGHPMQQTACT